VHGAAHTHLVKVDAERRRDPAKDLRDRKKRKEKGWEKEVSEEERERRIKKK